MISPELNPLYCHGLLSGLSLFSLSVKHGTRSLHLPFSFLLTLLDMRWIVLTYLAAFVAGQKPSLRLFDNTSFPPFSEDCTSALTANLSCAFLEVGGPLYQLTANYTDSFLEELCTEECAKSIADYRSEVISACDNDVFNDTADGTTYGSASGRAGGAYLPIVLPDYYFTNYHQRCLRNLYGLLSSENFDMR